MLIGRVLSKPYSSYGSLNNGAEITICGRWGYAGE
jgi:hypothetical protein